MMTGKIKDIALLVIGLCVIIALALTLVITISNHEKYPRASNYNSYSSNISFTYPANWKIECNVKNGNYLKLPGVYEGSYKNKEVEASISAFLGDECENGKIMFDTMQQKNHKRSHDCMDAERGIPLDNGLYLVFLGEPHSTPSFLEISQEECSIDTEQTIMSFRFSVVGIKNATTSTFAQIDRVKFLTSPQYADIKKMAESIRILEHTK